MVWSWTFIVRFLQIFWPKMVNISFLCIPYKGTVLSLICLDKCAGNRKNNWNNVNNGVNPFKILDSSKLKEFTDDNFKFDENGRKFSKWVENTEGKGEIAHYLQFLLFPVFSKD